MIASLLELSERRLQQLVAEGWIPKPMHGQYSLRDSIRGYIRYLRQNAKEHSRGSEAARLARAQAVKVEMENFRRMNELQVTSQVEGLMQGLVVMMKSSLEGLPGRLSGELAGINDAPEIYNRLQSELRSICALCADYLDKQADALAASEEPREDDAAVAEDDTGELGQGESDDAGGQSGAGKVPAGADAIHDSPD